MPGTPFFSWPVPFVRDFLGNKKSDILFIPYAAVTFSMDEYTSLVKGVFESLGHTVFSLHLEEDHLEAVGKAEVIVIGGGNTFVLLNRLYEKGILNVIREKVFSGTPYIGWSAGANVACATMMTTNDMPVVYPPSFQALNLVPFQINPHYSEIKPAGHGGETRQQRIEEFLVMNPHKKVIGLPEGMLLQKENEKLVLKGQGVARLFQFNTIMTDLSSGSDVSHLLV
jgi:dipeptidase E